MDDVSALEITDPTENEAIWIDMAGTTEAIELDSSTIVTTTMVPSTTATVLTNFVTTKNNTTTTVTTSTSRITTSVTSTIVKEETKLENDDNSNNDEEYETSVDIEQDIYEEDSESEIVEEDQASSTELESIYNVTDEEYILLCNVVGHEAGSDWIGTYEKCMVLSVIFNRMMSRDYPNTIKNVIAKGGFDDSWDYINLTYTTGEVTDAVFYAVDCFLSNPQAYASDYYGFWGDGYENHFY